MKTSQLPKTLAGTQLDQQFRVALTKLVDEATARIDALGSGEAAAATAAVADLQVTFDVAKAFVTGKYNAATVDSIDDATGPIAGGDDVTLTGTNFSHVYEVAFGAVIVPVEDWVILSPTSIYVRRSPAQGAGAVNIRVRNPVGQSATGAGNVYTYS